MIASIRPVRAAECTAAKRRRDKDAKERERISGGPDQPDSHGQTHSGTYIPPSLTEGFARFERSPPGRRREMTGLFYGV